MGFFLPCYQVVAVEKSRPKNSTRIRSDIIDVKRKSQTIDFINNVVVEKGDSNLLADKMTVFYNEEKQDSNQGAEINSSIKRIEAKENVRIFSDDFVASGNEGYYDPIADVFVLEKNVTVNNGTSIATGNKFVYELKTKKGHFVGKKSEASAEDGQDKRVVIVIGDDIQDQQNKNPKKSKPKGEASDQNIKREEPK